MPIALSPSYGELASWRSCRKLPSSLPPALWSKGDLERSGRWEPPQDEALPLAGGLSLLPEKGKGREVWTVILRRRTQPGRCGAGQREAPGWKWVWACPVSLGREQ